MKKQTKGLIFVVLFGGGLLFWATAASMPNVMPPNEEEEVTITGTPADNFPDSQRAQFCGTGQAKSNQYIQEYKIPTECTQPLAIVTDPQGNVWFAQTNTGKIAKFDPNSETFVEYDNPSWPPSGRSMMWGMDYSPDGSIWFTEEAYDSIWKFSISDEEYSRMTYPSSGDSLPQKLQVDGSQIIVNDFTGNKLTFLDPAQVGEEITYLSLPSPVQGSLTGDFAVDSENNVWYTNWVFQQDGILVKFDQEGYNKSVLDEGIDSLPLFDYIQVYQLPADATTPNGVVVGPEGNIWIADTSSSFFFAFNPDTEEFTKYITSKPHQSTYGNASGLIKSPVSRPYWADVDNSGRIVFNEQTANRLGFFDPVEQSLVEYLIPSKNP
ncbi:MAG: lyase, partial [Nitrosopumilaceae archaeon]|nr:lyase [Nitrosopumilaceae archaeon]